MRSWVPGKWAEFLHVAFVDQLLVGLPDLFLDVLLLRALGLIDPKCLAFVVVATMLLGEELGRLFDERKVDPDPLVLNVHVHRFLDDFLLEALLQAFGFSSGR